MKLEQTKKISPLSRRVNRAKNTSNFLASAWYRQHENPFDIDTNPDGIINLGTAENKSLYDVIQAKLNDIDLGAISEEYTHYCKLSGTDQFRQKLSHFFNRFMTPSESLRGEDVFVMNGCGTVIESFGYSLCDEGDGILIPAPFYAGFKSDLEQRVGVKVVPVHLSSNDSFQLTQEHLADALESAEDRGIPIKALLLSNPNNPLGTMYTEEELETYAEFCYNHGIQLICDEIYMLSVYDDNASFQSILSLKNFQKYRDIIHVVWGFSKDFGLSGFRCGIAITKNVELQSAFTSVGYYTSVPTVTQYILEELITDTQWLDKLVYINHQRLQKARDTTVNTLCSAKIPFVYPTGGLFVWMDLSKFLKNNKNKDAEMEMFESLMNNGLYIVPGMVFEMTEYGWFRLIISSDIEVLKVALSRILKTVGCTTAITTTEFIKSGSRRHADTSVSQLEASVRHTYQNANCPLNN